MITQSKNKIKNRTGRPSKEDLRQRKILTRRYPGFFNSNMTVIDDRVTMFAERPDEGRY